MTSADKYRYAVLSRASELRVGIRPEWEGRMGQTLRKRWALTVNNEIWFVGTRKKCRAIVEAINTGRVTLENGDIEAAFDCLSSAISGVER